MVSWPGCGFYPYGYYPGAIANDSYANTQWLEPDDSPRARSPEYSPAQREDSPVQDEETQRYSYCLKFFNPDKRSKFVVDKLRRNSKFKSPTEVRECLTNEFKQLVSSRTNFEIGFNSGQRGSTKIWIKDEEDLRMMYLIHNKPEQEIVLWCEGVGNVPKEKTAATSSDLATSGRKRRAVDDGDRPISKRQLIQDEVDGIFAQLEEEHGSQFTPAQYRLWANMVQVGTHKQYDTPPNVPMFGLGPTATTKKTTNLSDALTSVAEGIMRVWKQPECSCSKHDQPTTESSVTTSSSSATLRSQHIQQLKELHQLYEIGAITKEEYEHQKGIILKKMDEL